MSDNMKTISAISWASLLLAILALILAWAAYNRAGQDLEQQAQNQTIKIQEEVRQQVAIAEARARLLVLKSRLATGLAGNEATQEISETRRELRAAFQDVSGKAYQEWQGIDQNLEQVESQFRNNSADALGSLERLINRLKKDIRTENN